MADPIQEAKKYFENSFKPGCECEECAAGRIALWFIEREPYIRAMEEAYYDTDSRHAYQDWCEDNPMPGERVSR